MPELRFRYPVECCQKTLLRRAFFATWGRVPSRSRVVIDDGILSVSSEIRGTGTVHVPFPHSRLGVVLQSTDTLAERERPYNLLKELARGSLGRILRRSFEWQMFGFRPSPRLKSSISKAIREFSILATMDEDSSEINLLALGTIDKLNGIIMQLGEQYVEQSLTARTRLATKLPIILGVDMNEHPAPESVPRFKPYATALKDVFHTINVTPSWREIETEPGEFNWERLERRLSVTRQYGFRGVLGPIIQFERNAIPSWVLDSLDTGEDISSHAVHYARFLAERFGNDVETWVLASNLNSQSILSCPVLRAIQAVREIAETMRDCGINRPLLIGIEQPWGDYHIGSEQNIPIVGIAESFVNCKEIDGILLEINLGLSRNCTLPRDPIMLGSLIDQWSHLGKKIYVSLSIPSELGSNPSITDEYIGLSFEWTRKIQQEWIHRYLPMLISKRSVYGIIWNQLEDDIGTMDEHGVVQRHPSFSGLFDLRGKFKPAFRKITSIRNTFLE